MIKKLIPLLFLFVGFQANAAIIGYVPTTTFGGLGGGSVFEGLFASDGHTVKTVDLSIAGGLTGIDGLWLHGGGYSLTAQMQTNLGGFLGLGKNVVYITDRSDAGPYSDSTASVLAVVGGDDVSTGGDMSSYSTLGSHDLVTGVSDIRFTTWSAVNPGLGSPELLTSNGMAAVYDYVGAGELLFLGDTNFQSGTAYGYGCNDGSGVNGVFCGNIVDWVASPSSVVSSNSVPEPSIIALFAAGLFGIGFARRRKV
jgi:hypothetical protein